MNFCKKGMAWALESPSLLPLTSVRPSCGKHSAPPLSTPAEVSALGSPRDRGRWKVWTCAKQKTKVPVPEKKQLRFRYISPDSSVCIFKHRLLLLMIHNLHIPRQSISHMFTLPEYGILPLFSSKVWTSWQGWAAFIEAVFWWTCRSFPVWVVTATETVNSLMHSCFCILAVAFKWIRF